MKTIQQENQKTLLLNEFDLSDNNFDISWINNIISNPIAKNVLVQLKDGDMEEQDFYINFDELTFKKNNNKNQFYIDLNREIKKHISKVWGCSKINHIYTYYKLEEDSKHIKYLFFYFSNKKSSKILNSSLFKYNDTLVRYILDLLIKSTLMETLSENAPLKSDLFSGNFYLNPILDEKLKTINLFSYFVSYRNSTLKFKLENKYSRLDTNPIEYDDICFLNKNLKYSRKLDARQYNRPFLAFKNYEHFKKTKFLTQFETYKLIHKTLNKFHIKYKQKYFEPKYFYNNFNTIENDINNIKIVITDIEKYSIDRFHNLQKQILNTFKINTEIITNPNFENLTKNDIYLFVQPEQKDNQFIYSNDEQWTTAIYPFMEQKLYDLSLEDFLVKIKEFDIYSQFKLYNIYANYKGFEPYISQGWVLDTNVPFEDGSSKEDNEKNIHVLQKIINELNLKYSLFLKKKLFLNFDNYFDVKTIKVVTVTKVEKDKIFTVIDFKINNESKGAELIIKNIKMLINNEINSLNLPIDVTNEKDYKDSYIFINEEYIIKSKDNDLMPFIICKKEIYENKDLDFMDKVNEHILKGNSLSTEVSRSYNLFYPYITSTNNVLLKSKLNKYTYTGCHIEYLNKEANIFMMMQNFGPKKTIKTNNRLENIQLFKLEDFDSKKLNIENHQDLLGFYLSTLPFNYLNISELSKKSILSKLSEIIVNN